MKTHDLLGVRTLALFVGSMLCFPASLGSAQAGGAGAETEFPHSIQPELGAAEYASGDRIVIASVRGNRAHLEPGGRYLVEGTYTLESAEGADLAWFLTSRGPSGSVPVADDEHVKIAKGSGKFRLKKTLQGDGWLHLSFYVNGKSHGGTYFGEKGVETTILRQKGWSDFSEASWEGTSKLTSPANGAGSAASDPANLAIIAFLGKPVAVPANLDAKYTAANLLAALKELCRRADLQPRKLEVDASEFPFLVSGLLTGKHEFRELENGLREMKGYGYAGSVTGTTDKEDTYFAINITPYDQIPGDQAVACNRRLMVRLQMLAETVRHAE